MCSSFFIMWIRGYFDLAPIVAPLTDIQANRIGEILFDIPQDADHDAWARVCMIRGLLPLLLDVQCSEQVRDAVSCQIRHIAQRP